MGRATRPVPVSEVEAGPVAGPAKLTLERYGVTVSTTRAATLGLTGSLLATQM